MLPLVGMETNNVELVLAQSWCIASKRHWQVLSVWDSYPTFTKASNKARGGDAEDVRK